MTDPPYLVNYLDRSGRTIANDSDGGWLAPAFANFPRDEERQYVCELLWRGTVDLFSAAWRAAGLFGAWYVISDMGPLSAIRHRR